jgi:GT2 family glycosyltransferase
MISAIIPHYIHSTEYHEELLEKCVASLDADEVIVVVTDIGMGKAINKGLGLARGDFLVVLNNDTELRRGSLKDLCDEGAVTCPQITNTMDQLPRSFYCMPRWVYEKVGGYDEQFKVGYFEDDDLIKRWQLADVPIKHVPEVFVQHVGGATLDKHPDRQKIFDENKRLYEEKWKDV